jgi:hypothetical protein
MDAATIHTCQADTEGAALAYAPPTIDGQVVLSIRATQTAINAGRSTVYRLIQDGLLKVVEVKGVGPRVTAASILQHLGMAPATKTVPPAAPGGAEAEDTPPPRRRGRPRSLRGHYLPAGSQAVA